MIFIFNPVQRISCTGILIRNSIRTLILQSRRGIEVGQRDDLGGGDDSLGLCDVDVRRNRIGIKENGYSCTAIVYMLTDG